MRPLIRKILYSKFVKFLNLAILSLFYNRKYLKGKYFDQSRYGFVWAWKSLPRRIMHLGSGINWPIGHDVRIPVAKNIVFDNSSINVFQSHGCYYQNQLGKIIIGKDVYIAPNVGVITSNHDPADPNKHLPGTEVHIGDGCWIGMNAVILPGVILGSRTIVGAGAVVTKSVPEGNCVIAGNPAKKIRDL